MNATLTDEEMIRQYLLSKPNQCFEIIYNRYVNKIYRRCLSMTKDSDKAEDFTHDIFLKAFDKLDAFQERSSFSTWLHAIAYNYCSDQLRLSKRFNTISISANLEQCISESQEARRHEETLQLVKQGLNTLSANERTVLDLKYEGGMSIEEIAKLHNLKLSAVKMRLKRGREKVYQFCLQQYPI
ncbi:sigma-70 family RNA polymerase sigma factor [Spirosoma sp. HMF3257]|uniref:RNA polymerase subunit sigma-70 n=1 Tax=Spirosoma telluris TaxID=2183553 RepID=A0A327NNC9_9BACT|nr:sigma-70 family RNA polymerase sigma factor [Spirosoma telluris]RAI76712.1 RNA polymerase subunit sigma-70 [Spirosoma telluris]